MDDLIQEVLTVVVREVGQFAHNRRTGAFRSWLRTILAHRLQGFWRAQKSRPLATGDGDWETSLQQLEDPQSHLSRLWDREHDHHIMRRLLEQVEARVSASTWQAFRLVVLENKSEEDAARELGLSMNAVFIAKSRVLAKLRQEAKDLIDLQ